MYSTIQNLKYLSEISQLQQFIHDIKQPTCLLVIWVLFALSQEQLHGVLVELAQDHTDRWIKLSTVDYRKPMAHHHVYCI